MLEKLFHELKYEKDGTSRTINEPNSSLKSTEVNFRQKIIFKHSVEPNSVVGPWWSTIRNSRIRLSLSKFESEHFIKLYLIPISTKYVEKTGPG